MQVRTQPGTRTQSLIDRPCYVCGRTILVPPDMHLCPDCRREEYDTLAKRLDPSFVPSTDTDVLVMLRPLEIIHAYQGDHPNHDHMAAIIYPIAEAEKAAVRRKYGKGL